MPNDPFVILKDIADNYQAHREHFHRFWDQINDALQSKRMQFCKVASPDGGSFRVTFLTHELLFEHTYYPTNTGDGPSVITASVIDDPNSPRVRLYFDRAAHIGKSPTDMPGDIHLAPDILALFFHILEKLVLSRPPPESPH